MKKGGITPAFALVVALWPAVVLGLERRLIQQAASSSSSSRTHRSGYSEVEPRQPGEPGTATPHWTDLYVPPKVYPPYVPPPFPPKNPDGFLEAKYWEVVGRIKDEKHAEDTKRLKFAVKELAKQREARAAIFRMPYGPRPGSNKKLPYGVDADMYEPGWTPPTTVNASEPKNYTVYDPPNATAIAMRTAAIAEQRQRNLDVEAEMARKRNESAEALIGMHAAWNAEAVANSADPVQRIDHPSHPWATGPAMAGNGTLDGPTPDKVLARAVATQKTQHAAFYTPAFDADGKQLNGVYQNASDVGALGEEKRARAAEALRVSQERAKQKAGVDLSWRSGV